MIGNINLPDNFNKNATKQYMTVANEEEKKNLR
jgi:hypothetical protein